ncbi:MAG: methylated-DNA--[protein]-cysteine S-methyltransferase [Clostridia bacterium]|nr:methylated-DNA--[protein]-cysteine S-methyltransferase [Clostridia bacterium]
MFYTKYESIVAPMILVGDEKGIARLYFDIPEAKKKLASDAEWEYNDSFFDDVKSELKEYFEGSRKAFSIKLNPSGTAFQKNIWNILMRIPYGETRTYSQIATDAGNPNASRAAGSAAGRNPIPIIIPCHRVIGASGQLTGYAFGVEMKKNLLELEKKHI